MEFNEYKEQLEKLNTEYNSAKKNLQIKYGLSKAIFKVDDIINDTIKTIKIDKITVNINFNGIPEPVYSGYELNKDLSPKKNKSRGTIWGNGYENCPVTLIK